MLGLVPWGLLIEKAPTIASGAADLYARVRRDRREAPPVPVTDPMAGLAAMEGRIAALEADLQGSAALIADLAAANAGLMAAVERARRATLATGLTAILALGVAVTALVV